jgi:hypothetical protein
MSVRLLTLPHHKEHHNFVSRADFKSQTDMFPDQLGLVQVKAMFKGEEVNGIAKHRNPDPKTWSAVSLTVRTTRKNIWEEPVMACDQHFYKDQGRDAFLRAVGKSKVTLGQRNGQRYECSKKECPVYTDEFIKEAIDSAALKASNTKESGSFLEALADSHPMRVDDADDDGESFSGPIRVLALPASASSGVSSPAPSLPSFGNSVLADGEIKLTLSTGTELTPLGRKRHRSASEASYGEPSKSPGPTLSKSAVAEQGFDERCEEASSRTKPLSHWHMQLTEENVYSGKSMSKHFSCADSCVQRTMSSSPVEVTTPSFATFPI